ncbi:MAG: protein-L-isoaspartate(D-aspartate) O-methyltransferase [Marinilabiliales bacterium]
MIDTYKHKGLRKKLVESLMEKGITDINVLEAINTVPRHFFMKPEFDNFAYKDQAFPIKCNQTISQPYTVAFQSQLLEIKKGDKVLEIGTGSGYQAAILSVMGAKVYTIERHYELFIETQKLLKQLNYKVETYYGDGYKGKPAFAPFDKILLTASPPVIPEELLKQLKTGGYMVLPLGDRHNQKMIRIIKKSEDDYIKEDHGSFIFVPMLKGTSKLN